MTDPAAPSFSPACVACGGRDLEVVESIAANRLVDAWRAEDRATGAAATERRAHGLLAALPEEIRFERCPRCGLEMTSSPVVWSAGADPRDRSYPVRWEFLRCIDALEAEPLNVLELECGPGEFLALATLYLSAVCGAKAHA